MRTTQQWIDHIHNNMGLITHSDIDAIQQDAIDSYKAQYHNPMNVAKANKIKASMGYPGTKR